MSYIIEDNNFTKDSRGVRATRLYFLSHSIDTYAATLSITGDMLTWAQGAVAAFDAAQDKQSAELGEKNEAFQTSQEADAELQERYQILKELLQARYGEADDKLQIYGITGPTPRARDDVIDKAEYLIEGNDRQTAAGDPLALPQTMIDNLQALVTDAKDKYYDAGIERREAEEATDEINDLYDADSVKLRSIYHWIVAFWGKKDPRLIDLGFVTAKEHGGGQAPDAPQNLEYDSVAGRFSWIESEGATSYQLAYRETGSDDEWQVAYSGSDTSVVFNPSGGNWQFRVRARNEHGYGEWSNTITVEIAGGIPAPDWVKAVYSGIPPKVTEEQVEVTWGNVAEATMYEVWRSVVKVGDPAGDFSLIGEEANEMYLDFDLTKNKRNYYYIIAKNATDRSEPSVVAFDDIVD